MIALHAIIPGVTRTRGLLEANALLDWIRALVFLAQAGPYITIRAIYNIINKKQTDLKWTYLKEHGIQKETILFTRVLIAEQNWRENCIQSTCWRRKAKIIAPQRDAVLPSPFGSIRLAKNSLGKRKD